MQTRHSKPVKDRLDEELYPLELDQLSGLFVEYLVDNEINPQKQNVNKELGAVLFGEMA